MLKRYYTLQEAADYLGEKTDENRLSVADVLELVGDGKARLCAEYSGSVCAFWEELFGGRVYWAAVEPYYVRGYFCLSGSARSDGEYDSRIGRSTISFNFVPTEPVEIKDFEFSDGDAVKGYREAMAKFASKEPTPASLKSAAELKGEELPESEYKYFETVVYFGGFIDGTGYPKPDYAKISIDACLIPKDDLDAILTGGQPDNTLRSAIENRTKDERYAVGIKKLNLHDWPLMSGKNSTLYDAVNKSLPWVKDAIKSNEPKLVYPAQLAILLQQENNGSSLRANPEVLRRYLAANFPDCLDDYEAHIDFGKADVT